jgi:hypothetical protein
MDKKTEVIILHIDTMTKTIFYTYSAAGNFGNTGVANASTYVTMKKKMQRLIIRTK